MKRKYNKMLVTLFGIFLLIIPANVDALISLKGTSVSGKITISAAVLIPLPPKTITESGETDFLGIAQLTIIESDDINKYNLLQISMGMGSEEPIKLPVPYGSF